MVIVNVNQQSKFYLPVFVSMSFNTEFFWGFFAAYVNVTNSFTMI